MGGDFSVLWWPWGRRARGVLTRFLLTQELLQNCHRQMIGFNDGDGEKGDNRDGDENDDDDVDVDDGAAAADDDDHHHVVVAVVDTTSRFGMLVLAS